MKVKFKFGTGYAGADHEDIAELPDDYTDEQIEAEWKEWVWNNVDGYWKKFEGDEEDA